MRHTRILLIDISGAGNNLVPKWQFKNCVWTCISSSESEIFMHLLTHEVVVLVDSDFSGNMKNLIKSIHTAKPRVLIIAISREPTSQQVVSAYRAGLSDYFFLPVDKKKLCELLQSICRKKSIGSQFSSIRKSTWRYAKLLSGWMAYTIRSVKVRFSLVRRNWRKKRTLRQSALNGKFSRLAHMPDLLPNSSPQRDMDSLAMSPKFALATPAIIGSHELVVTSLGKLQVSFQNRIIERWPSRKGRGIFAYIATSGRKIYRDVLMENFWPDTATDSARNSLNVALHGLRRTFSHVDEQRECILYRDECYFLNPELHYYCDTHAFCELYNEARVLENRHHIEAAIDKYHKAAELYHGDFMEEDLYEEWPTLERENLREKYFAILEILGSYYIKSKNYAEATRMCEQILLCDSCREDVHRKLMLCHYYSGQRDKALRQFQQCQKSMSEDLGVVPSRATFELKDKIQAEQLIM
ncbi:MAG: hypothetical protein DWQ10_11855 [Calditrichaeota bacterium]|nr:MAG: hypothetical protein DWQ10_11855 [Calditrichota bacterium]